MMGFSAIERTISAVTIPPLESPRKTSAPTMASASVLMSVRAEAKARFISLRSVRAVVIAPRESNIRICSLRTPSEQ